MWELYLYWYLMVILFGVLWALGISYHSNIAGIHFILQISLLIWNFEHSVMHVIGIVISGDSSIGWLKSSLKSYISVYSIVCDSIIPPDFYLFWIFVLHCCHATVLLLASFGFYIDLFLLFVLSFWLFCLLQDELPWLSFPCLSLTWRYKIYFLVSLLVIEIFCIKPKKHLKLISRRADPKSIAEFIVVAWRLRFSFHFNLDSFYTDTDNCLPTVCFVSDI